MRSPYDILGIKPTADADEIRKAFRKQAKLCHPDLKPGDKQAETRFKEISAAYELLSDPAKRARFDRGEIDAEGRETFSHAYARSGAGFDPFGGRHGPGGPWRFEMGADGDVSDLFEQVFSRGFGGGAGRARGGGQAGGRGPDRHHSITVDFVEAALGATKRIPLPEGRSLDVTIPPGLKSGQTLRLKGQGAAVPGGQAGDLLLKVEVAPHKLFRREGDDVHLDLPVSLMEAVAGGRVTVPTLTGKVVLSVPANSNTGSALRLKGKGIRGGDLYVTLKVVLPDKPDAELNDFLRRWGERHPYDPRAGMVE